MSAIGLSYSPGFDSFVDSKEKNRRAAIGKGPGVFADVYLEETNIVIWQRGLSNTLKNTVSQFVKSNPFFQTVMTVSPHSVLPSIRESLGHAVELEFSENIAELVDMFCYLFQVRQVGLRLAVLDHGMCPNFHVDRVPCRLVTTYHGVATEWLSHNKVNREKLGASIKTNPDDRSGLYKNQNDIQQLSSGDVALLKGELWEGNEKAGLVHRSPSLSRGDRRLLLTIDFGS